MTPGKSVSMEQNSAQPAISSSQPVATYGVAERAACEDAIDLAVEEIEVRGYTVIDAGISAVRLDELRASLDAVYDRQVIEAGGDDELARINDANVTRAPLAYDRSFLDLALHPAVLTIARRMLGESFVLVMQNGVTNPANQAYYQARWHRDLNYQHWVSSRPIAISALFCLDRFDVTTGGTWVLPGTHWIEAFPSDAFVARHQTSVCAPAGSILISNAMLFHRAGENRSPNPRRAVNHVIGRPFLGQQIDLPRLLGHDAVSDPSACAYLGFRWNPKSSVAEWRAERLRR